VPFGDWQQTTLRLAKNCTNKRERFSSHIWTGGGPQISTQDTIAERIAFEAAVLRAETTAQSIGEKSAATLKTRLGALHELHENEKPTPETIPDFASLLRKPAEAWPAPTHLDPRGSADFIKSFGDTLWRRRARIHPL
jgi:hypothetical protein